MSRHFQVMNSYIVNVTTLNCFSDIFSSSTGVLRLCTASFRSTNTAFSECTCVVKSDLLILSLHKAGATTSIITLHLMNRRCTYILHNDVLLGDLSRY